MVDLRYSLERGLTVAEIACFLKRTDAEVERRLRSWAWRSTSFEHTPATLQMAAMCDYFFDIEVHQGAITVSSSDPKFCATYYTHSDKAHLCLRHRTYTEDRELLLRRFKPQSAKLASCGGLPDARNPAAKKPRRVSLSAVCAGGRLPERPRAHRLRNQHTNRFAVPFDWTSGVPLLLHGAG